MTNISATVTWNNDILKRLKTASEVNSVEVGYPDGLAYENGMSVREVAVSQEFGTPRIPPRPFLRTAIAREGVAWAARIAGGVTKCEDRSQFVKLYEEVGAAICDAVRRSIDSVSDPKLSGQTISRRRAKGNMSEKPLVDTGTMRNGISYRVGPEGEWKK